jgi:ubiquinone/menaquinone biosynthesis C-methylase UbiE
MHENSNKNINFQWDQYWSCGNIHSLSSAANGNYKGAIARFWKARFATIGSGAKILDIGTGNGSVAFFAAEVAQKEDLAFQIKAVDLARIDPVSATKSHPELAQLLPYIEFQGETSADKLPYSDNYFDLVVGQYALEYTPLESTMAELRRVLKPEGQMAFIMHHTNSIIMKTTQDELEQAKLIFDETKLFLRARSLILAMGDANTPEKIERLRFNENAQNKRHSLNQAFAFLQKQAETRENSMFLRTALNYVSEVFKAKALSINERLNYLQLCQQLIEGNRERIRDMCSASFDSDRSLEFSKLCVTKGFNEPGFLSFYNDQKELLGWEVGIQPDSQNTG